jgi:hypothetical protein
VSEHELGAALFFEAYRRRWRDRISAGAKSRRKLLDGLYHFDHLDRRFATRVAGRDRSPGRQAAQLRARGAPHTCYVIAAAAVVHEMPLETALEDTIGIPGRLAYLEGENIGDRYMERTA